MYDVTFCADFFASPETMEYGEFALGCMLWTLIAGNLSYLRGEELEGRAGSHVPLYDSGIYWKREEPVGRSPCKGGNGQEQFLGIAQVLEQGFADCEDVASYRVAEVRMGLVPPVRGLPPFPGHPKPIVLPVPWNRLKPRGVPVLPAFFKRETMPGAWTYHIIVAWPDPRLGFVFEDPSRVLGMGGQQRADRFG